MGKSRINITVAPTAKVADQSWVPGGDNGVLFINSTGGFNRLSLQLPDGTVKESTVDSSGAIAFV